MCESKKRHVRVCGQCSEPTDGSEESCPVGECSLVLCGTCSNHHVHVDENGNCARWWGEGLSDEEVEERMDEVSKDFHSGVN